ncbi:GNAT family N-acetyltransferase [Streptomyces sp. NPDC050732]|uniref:GNAT family N-acetyltransferase n=1 Tax=Streptomyces sp. NPDC050732 TaxID=3154632 RepID=UPI00342A4E96
MTGTELLTRHTEDIRSVYAEAFAQPPWNEAPAEADHYLKRLADDASRPGFTAAVALDGGEHAPGGGRSPRFVGDDAARPGFTAAVALDGGGHAPGADRPSHLIADDASRPELTAALALGGGAPASGADRPSRLIGFATAWTTATPLPDTRSYPLVTAALGARAHDWLGGSLQVDELAVRPDAHGLGVGRALLAAVTRDAPDGRCWLLTGARATDAVRFYRRVGWHQIAHPAPDSRDVAVFLGPEHPARAEAGRWRSSRR